MKKIFCTIIMLAAAYSLNAQFVYENNYIRFNGARFSTAMTTWNGWFHAWVNGSKLIRMDLSTTDPRFATNTDKIVFMDSSRSFYNDIYARNFYNYSDVAAKTNIKPVNNALQSVLALKPVTYKWQDQAEYLKYKRTSTYATDPKEIGFLAQDVEKVLPDIIGIDDMGNKLVNYNAIIPMLTAAIQELNARIEYLEEQLISK